MSLNLPSPLPTLVRTKYATALSNHALTFASSDLAIIPVNGIPFQLRYCPSLAHKPSSIPAHAVSTPTTTPHPKPNPFLNPDPALLIHRLPNHNLLLNKYPIIPHHFILATREPKRQTQPLDASDLKTTYDLLRSWSDGDGDANADGGGKSQLFAFFNSGDASGASQAHRHVQFLPVEAMQHAEKGAWRLLMDELVGVEQARLPFRVHAVALSADVDAEALRGVYTRLLERVYADVRTAGGAREDVVDVDGEGCVTFSYNLGMTTRGMVMCARRAEGVELREAGYVAVNGTVLGGTLMVKERALFDVLRMEGLEEVLRAVGVPTEYTTEYTTVL